MDEKLIVSMVVVVGCALYAAYQMININKCEKVIGTLTGYDEDTQYDAGLDQVVSNKYPIYEFYYNGRLKQYRSKVNAISFLRCDERTLYINSDEKIFDMWNVYGTLLLGFIAFMVGFIG